MKDRMTPRPTRLLLAFAVFVVSLVVFDRLFFTALQLAQAAPNARPDLLRKLEALPDKTRYQMLILGTSRMYEAVHPAVIRGALSITAFKEAFLGKGPRYNYEFYQVYERIVGRPRWVVYGVDYFIFELRSAQWAMARFETEAPVNAGQEGFLLTMTNKSANDRAIVRLLTEMQQEALRVHQFDPERFVSDMDAYTGSSGPGWARPEVPASYTKVGFRRYPGVEGEYFFKLLDQWEREGVAVLLIDPPEYVGTHETNYERRAFVDTISGLIRGRKDFAFIEYSDANRFPLQDAAYFGDGGYGSPNSHLSRDGAAAFARIFIPDLERFVAEHPGAPRRGDR